MVIIYLKMQFVKSKIANSAIFIYKRRQIAARCGIPSKTRRAYPLFCLMISKPSTAAADAADSAAPKSRP